MDAAARRDFVAREYPAMLDAFERMPFGVMQADLFRYMAIHRFGGVYADIDVECARPFGPLLALGGAVLGVEARLTRARQLELGYARPRQIANFIFAGEAGHPFFAAAIDRAVKLSRANPRPTRDRIEDITGPRMLTRLFYERPFAKVSVLAQAYWAPSRDYPDIWPFNANVYARHHFAGTWKGDEPRKPFRRRWIERDIPPNPWPRHMTVAIAPADEPDSAERRPQSFQR
jgi:mannosyltransferase OCH1-like enzyme